MSPYSLIFPPSNHIAESQNSCTCGSECEINTIVFPSSFNSCIRSRHFLAKDLSPTDNASSIIIISGFRQRLIENPSLDFIPLEYFLTGWYKKSPISANSITPSTISCTLFFDKPSKAPFSSIFSRPVSCLLSPVLMATSACSPLTMISPSSGDAIPDKTSAIVDFPEPFVPSIPRTCPFFT